MKIKDIILAKSSLVKIYIDSQLKLRENNFQCQGKPFPQLQSWFRNKSELIVAILAKKYC